MISQSVNQIVKYYGTNNTVMDGAHVHVYFAPNTEETAKKISDLLGTKTEIHTQENFAGHRLAPWLGHIMVSRQQTARPLLTPGEVRELPPADEIVIVAGLPPIRTGKLRFYNDPTFRRCVPPTDADGRLAVAAHPLNPPTNLAARPYPYGPPVPEPVWRVSHAKPPSGMRAGEAHADGLEHTRIAEDEHDKGAEVLVEEPNSPGAPPNAPPGVFGFDDHDRHRHADPDIGWNLPA